MRNHGFFQVIALGLVVSAGGGRADPLDDLLAGLRSGAVTTVDPAVSLAAFKAADSPTRRAYQDGIADLYLSEIKFSIIDPDHNSGWPYRSFLLDRFLEEEDNTALRRHLTTRLKERFAERPEAVLAYALVCPAIFAEDENLIDQAQAFLKANDPFLFKLEQANVGGWRSSIKAVLTREEGDVAALREVRFAKLADLAAKRGHDVTLDSSVTTTLGLTEPGQSLSVRQLSVAAKKDGSIGHAYMRTSDGGFLLFTVSAAGTRVYRANGKQVLLAAVEKKSKEEPTTILPADATKELAAEMTYWLSLAESF